MGLLTSLIPAPSPMVQLRRGFALSIMLAGSAVGAMLLPVLAQAVITLGVARRLPHPRHARLRRRLSPDRDIRPRTPGCSTESGRLTELGEPVARALKTPAFWIIAATVFLYAISVNGAIAHLSAPLTDRGVSATGAAYSVAVIGATSLIGRLLTGIFLDRFFGPRVSQIMLLMTVLGIVPLSVANSLTAGLIAAGFIGFSMGSEGDITPYLLGRYFGLKRFSTLYALTWTTYAIGGAAGPVIVGRVFDTLGSYRPITIQLLALPCSSLACSCSRFLVTRFKPAQAKPSSSSRNLKPVEIA